MSIFSKLLKGAGGLLGLTVAGLGGYAAYASATFESRLFFPDTPYPAIKASTDPEVIERGRYLARGPAHCSQCHSSPDREHPERIKDTTLPLSGGLLFDMGPVGRGQSANLTSDPVTGIGKLTDQDIARTIRTGVRSTGELSVMMVFVAKPSDEDLTAIVSYLRSLEPTSNEIPKAEWGLLGKMLFPMLPFRPAAGVAPKGVPASAEASVERGEYLAESIALCTTCHTAMNPMTAAFEGPKAGGSYAEPSHGADSDMEFVAPNLTSDPTGITGKLTEDQFVARIQGGRAYPSSIMPWENFGLATEADLRSIYRYLHSLPPIQNDTGPSYRKIGWKAGE